MFNQQCYYLKRSEPTHSRYKQELTKKSMEEGGENFRGHYYKLRRAKWPFFWELRVSKAHKVWAYAVGTRSSHIHTLIEQQGDPIIVEYLFFDGDDVLVRKQ